LNRRELAPSSPASSARAGIPSAMILICNANGSHNSHEALERNDFAADVHVLGRAMHSLASAWPTLPRGALGCGVAARGGGGKVRRADCLEGDRHPADRADLIGQLDGRVLGREPINFEEWTGSQSPLIPDSDQIPCRSEMTRWAMSGNRAAHQSPRLRGSATSSTWPLYWV
jgi:hypothetical protein